MFTHYIFGAPCDTEMLHKIYNAEPVAPFIEIPRYEFGNASGYYASSVMLFISFFSCRKQLHRKEKRTLLEEQNITFIKNENFFDFRGKLVEAFPKLSARRGFHLLRTAVTSRTRLEVKRYPPAGYNSKYLCDRRGLGQCMVSIRPLQSTLSMSPANLFVISLL